MWFGSLLKVIYWMKASSPFYVILITLSPKRSYCKWKVMQSAFLWDLQFLRIQWFLCYLVDWLEGNSFLIKSSLQQKVTLSLFLKSPRSARPDSDHPLEFTVPLAHRAVGVMVREHVYFPNEIEVLWEFSFSFLKWLMLCFWMKKAFHILLFIDLRFSLYVITSE